MEARSEIESIQSLLNKTADTLQLQMDYLRDAILTGAPKERLLEILNANNSSKNIKKLSENLDKVKETL